MKQETLNVNRLCLDCECEWKGADDSICPSCQSDNCVTMNIRRCR